MDKDFQSRHKKRGCFRWVGRILLGFVALLVITLSVTLLAGAKAKSDLKAKYPPPGDMVDGYTSFVKEPVAQPSSWKAAWVTHRWIGSLFALR